ncbi:CHAT domain-containing protein [Fibrisoma montanum]|uniref:CHAT domain-containing protein n=1 Tax=Fibrisoma montanum TaxID=2305895 RepID=A0A418M6I0_9BACT|nr:CHAT domain-containing protein [Fibrisoma montanum]RIV21474.1 CHAT domain-containing protein [Fibrisoma montanum]
MKSPFLFVLFVLALLPRPGRGQSQLADTYRQRAETEYSKGHYELATTYYEKAYQLVRGTDPVRAANLCVDLSSMDYMKGHNRKAADRCLTGLQHLRAVAAPPDSALFKLYSSLGTYYIELFYPDSARSYFRRADALLARNPRIEQQIPLYVLFHLNNQGHWLLKTENYARCLTYLTKARQIALTYNMLDDLTYIQSNLAGCYNAMGNYDLALTHIKIANAFYHKPTIRKSQFLTGIGHILHKLHRYPEALRYFTLAERVLNQLPRKSPTDYLSYQINLWYMISSCHRSANQLTEAARYSSKAIQLHKKYLGSRGPLLAKVMIEQGRWYEARHEPARALQAYQTAIQTVCRDTTRPLRQWQNPVADAVSDEVLLLLAVSRKAALLKQVYRTNRQPAYLAAAIETYRYGVQLLERVRHGIDTEHAQLLFAARQPTLVPDAIDLTFEAYQHQPSQALRDILVGLFEQAQAGSLREALRLNAIKPRTIPAALLEREQKLKQQINELRRRPAGDSAASAELTASQLAWHQLLETFRQDYPAYYQLQYQQTNLSAQNLQQHLDNRTAYVAYVRNKNNLFMLVATRSSVNFIRQPIDSTRFSRQLTTLQQELYQDPIFARYKGMDSAAELYATCIEPMRPRLNGKTRLVIARDWSFNFLPFEVLETGRRANDYLTKQYAIAYAVSAEAFFQPTRQASTSRPVLMVAPFARAGAVLEAVNRQDNLKPLGSSEAEARAIGGQLLLGPAATLRAFQRTDLDRPVIYFATHAKTDDIDPANSHIAFFPGEADKLYTDDIYNLSLSSTGLVVLGACETGSGKVIAGEGVLSLARAFAFAGCPSVISTLWKANDETTSFLTIRLHEYLTQGLSTDEALQRARQDFFDSPLRAKYDHPYYWANYVLLGNHAPVMPVSHPGGAGWLLAFIGVVAIAFWQRNRLGRLMSI